METFSTADIAAFHGIFLDRELGLDTKSKKTHSTNACEPTAIFMIFFGLDDVLTKIVSRSYSDFRASAESGPVAGSNDGPGEGENDDRGVGWDA